MSFATTALTIGGTALSAISSITQGENAYSSALSMKQAEDYNASVLTSQAEQIQKSAELDISKQRKAASKLKSKQRALYGKAGVLLEGSPTEVIIDSAAEAELDMAITQYNADTQSRSKLSEASYHSYLGEKYLTEGEQAQDLGYFNAGTTILTSALNFASKYGNSNSKKG